MKFLSQEHFKVELSLYNINSSMLTLISELKANSFSQKEVHLAAPWELFLGITCLQAFADSPIS